MTILANMVTIAVVESLQDELDELRAENKRLALIVMDHEMADYKGEVAKLKSAIEELVADAEYGRSSERERCAKVVEQDFYPPPCSQYQDQYNAGVMALANKIRSLE